MGLLDFIAKILLSGLGLLIIMLIFSTLYHNYQLKLETNKYPPPGKLVKVNKRNMHVYCAGKGDIALIFMSGHGTSSPSLDFKPLWMRMSDDYRVVVVERAGYGWSETSPVPRGIDIILEETRKALSLAGEDGPYVLISHSMAGLEAICWAQKYPDEVKAIIGLDPGIPDVYERSPELLAQNSRLNIMYFVSRIGLTRFMDRKELERNLPLLKSKELSREDRDQAAAIFHKRSITRNMLNEVDCLLENARKIKNHPVPANTPMYFFISDGSDLKFPDWSEELTGYVSAIKLGRYKYLEGGHFMHHEKSALIADEAKRFLGEIRFDKHKNANE